MDTPKIYLAFRFNINLSKVVGENKIEKKNRIVKVVNNLLYSLNRCNDEKVMVKGTWAVENHTTLPFLMENHKEVLSELKSRLKASDELEACGFSGNLLTMMDSTEVEYALKSIVVNEEGSGLKDVFGAFSPIIRAENFMMHPSLISRLKAIGISAFSCSYSRTPKTALTSYIKPLAAEEKYNPITYVNETTLDKMTAILSVNSCDLFGKLGLKRFVKKMRKEQLSSSSKKNMLLLVDYEVTDNLKLGFGRSVKVSSGGELVESFNGLYGMLKKVAELDYVHFTTPYEYIKNNEANKEVRLSMDLAEGRFEGFSSFAENYYCTKIFSKIEEARCFSHKARAAVMKNGGVLPEELEQSMKKRVLALSSNNFNRKAFNEKDFSKTMKLCEQSLELAKKAYALVCNNSDDIKLDFDGEYHFSEESVNSLVFIDKKENEEDKKFFEGEKLLPSYNCPVKNRNGVVVLAKENLTLSQVEYQEASLIEVEENLIENDFIKLQALSSGAIKIIYKGTEFAKRSFRPQVRYGKKLYRGETEKISVYHLGIGQVMKIEGKLCIKNSQATKYQYTLTLINGIPSIYFDGVIDYPENKDNKNIGWEKKFNEVMPFEFALSFKTNAKNSFKVTRNNFFGDQSSYVIPTFFLERNKQIPSLNNAVTAGYIAVSNGKQGLLLGERVGYDFNFAFCPMRINFAFGEYSLKLNPFGAYSGKQFLNHIARTPISARVSRKRFSMFKNAASTFSGKRSEFSMIISPFFGDIPSEEVIKRCYVFAYSSYIKN